MKNKEYAVEFKNVSKIYKIKEGNNKSSNKSFYALKDINFQVEKGEIVGILGTNGSGKSTVSNILSGIVAPDMGEAIIKGEQALIAIKSGLNNQLTGIENIEFKGALLGFDKNKIEKIKKEVIEFSELGDFIYQPVKSYSSGMKSRLGFSISINIDADIIIIDEALSVGDVAFNEKCFDKIQELKDTLELNKTLTEYTPVNATILSRNKSYWFNTITIDKGSNSGIEKNMAVITKNGLIGKISKVSKTSSEVKLITSDDINFKVSVAIKTNNDDNYAILNGYNKKNGLIKASDINKSTEINKGDVVLTSGLGELIPAGIYIGTVEKIESDKYNLSKNVYIKTYQDFDDIHYVTVLKVKEW